MSRDACSIVIPGLVPGIYALPSAPALGYWMAGLKPGHDE